MDPDLVSAVHVDHQLGAAVVPEVARMNAGSLASITS